ncbi:MAG: ATP-binding cassette domain-containing protein, partial [Actinomycetes bacterium]
MSNTAVNLINVESAALTYGDRTILNKVSLGVGVGDRIGVVGRNGGGKSTLLKVLAGVGDLDSGRVTIAGGTDLSLVAQAPVMTPGSTVRQ